MESEGKACETGTDRAAADKKQVFVTVEIFSGREERQLLELENCFLEESGEEMYQALGFAISLGHTYASLN